MNSQPMNNQVKSAQSKTANEKNGKAALITLCVLGGIFLTILFIVIGATPTVPDCLSLGSTARVHDFDVEVMEIDMGKNGNAGYHLATVKVKLTNQGNNRADFDNTNGYSIYITSGERIYNVSSVRFYPDDLEPLQSLTTEFYFHIPNAIYDAEGELILHVKYSEALSGEEVTWKLN